MVEPGSEIENKNNAKSLGEQNFRDQSPLQSLARLPRVIDPVFVQIQDATLATTKLSKIVRKSALHWKAPRVLSVDRG
jgi:hypothetical protein